MRAILLSSVLVLLLACRGPYSELEGSAKPVQLQPASSDNSPDAGGGAPPSCDATMDWTPRPFTGPTFHVAATGTGTGSGTAADPWVGLQHAIDQAPDGAVLMLAAGTYSAVQTAYTDPTCGNCAPDKQHTVDATRGFLVTGKSLALIGAGAQQTVLKTNSGYGFLIEDACEVYLSDLAITGGVRDPLGDAADGAVVVRRSRATLYGVTVRDNTQLLPNNAYPGIAGLMLRQGADVLVMRSTIENNSWDGVTVFDDGKLRMYGSRVSQGNGVAVGVTWSGRALLVNNDLSNYWKGVGSFVDAKVEARNNTIHHHIGWGVWVTQNGRLDLYNNTIAYNDLLGASLDGATVSGTFVNNLVAYNGLFRVKRYGETTFGGRMGVRGGAPSEQPDLNAAYNVVFGNQLNDWVLQDGTTPVDPTTLGTNRITDPGLVSESSLVPKAGSALLDTGDPALTDPDGSRSDVGATGGPFAGKTGP